MSDNKFRLKRVLWFTAPAVVALLLYLGVGVLGPRLDEARERSHKERVLRLALYRQGLEPCRSDMIWPDLSGLSVTPDDMVIGISPAFTGSHGLIVSGDAVQLFCGDFYPSPPPPPASSQTQEPNQEYPPDPQFELGPTSPLDAALSRKVITLLQGEIARASNDYPHLGLDGVRYTFMQGGLCATAWSPQLHTRADKIVAVAGELINLIDATDALQAEEVRRRMDVLVARLDAEHQLLAQSDPRSVAEADGLRERAAITGWFDEPDLDSQFVPVRFEVGSDWCDQTQPAR